MDFFRQIFLFGTFPFIMLNILTPDKMPTNMSKNKISPENYWDFPLYFRLYSKIGYVFDTPQFWHFFNFGYFKSQISKCPNHIRIWPHVLGHRETSCQFNKQNFWDVHYVTPCMFSCLFIGSKIYQSLLWEVLGSNYRKSKVTL